MIFNSIAISALFALPISLAVSILFVIWFVRLTEIHMALFCKKSQKMLFANWLPEMGLTEQNFLVVYHLAQRNKQRRKYKLVINHPNQPNTRIGIIFHRISSMCCIVLAKELKCRALSCDIREKELDSLLRIATHDLKEPLRKITTYGTLIQNEIISDNYEVLDYIRAMCSCADRMQSLLDRLGSFVYLNHQTLKFKKIDLNEVINEVLVDLQVQIDNTKAEIKVDTLPIIDGDETSLRQMFQNLLVNALKFTRDGITPVVQILNKTSQKDKENSFITIEIMDNGIGFDPSKADDIMKPFVRLHGISEYEGNGIGLAICCRVAENHGGMIQPANRLDSQGSIFIVQLASSHEKGGQNIYGSYAVS